MVCGALTLLLKKKKVVANRLKDMSGFRIFWALSFWEDSLIMVA